MEVGPKIAANVSTRETKSQQNTATIGQIDLHDASPAMRQALQ
jgi:hypothetical protein